jgi:hypothetical protein
MRSKAVRVVLAVAALAMPRPVASGEPGPRPALTPNRVQGPFFAASVERALAGARRRLQDGECQRIYTEFEDEEGRPLRAALDRAGAAGHEYIDTLFFYDGTRTPQCTQRRVLAYTARSSKVVFVCVSQFMQAARVDPLLVEAALIHESLHSLGLGENPPTSTAITKRVMARCGG